MTYLVPVNEGNGLYIKKVIAKNLKLAEEKLYQYLFDKYDYLEGDSLEDIINPLYEKGIDIGDIYDIEEFN